MHVFMYFIVGKSDCLTVVYRQITLQSPVLIFISRGSLMKTNRQSVKRGLLAIAPIALTVTLTFAFASPVFAACDQSRLHVVRSEGAPGGVQFYDLAPSTVLPTYYYRFTTTDSQIIDNLNSAWVGHFTVRAVGDAAACGTTGTVRTGGTITYIFRDSLF